MSLKEDYKLIKELKEELKRELILATSINNNIISVKYYAFEESVIIPGSYNIIIRFRLNGRLIEEQFKADRYDIERDLVEFYKATNIGELPDWVDTDDIEDLIKSTVIARISKTIAYELTQQATAYLINNGNNDNSTGS